MYNLDRIIDIHPFSLNKSQKEVHFSYFINALTKHHYENCMEYKKILKVLDFDLSVDNQINQVPPIPVRLFKMYELLSVAKSDIIKTMISSGTSSQTVSKIFLDRITATNQTKVLVKIISSFTGAKRLPMLIIDTKSVIKDRNLFSARGAGILGFSLLGINVTYALDENMQLDFSAIDHFFQKHANHRILVFGFTFMIWEYFYRKLKEMKKKINLENSIMIHGGGWKKMIEKSVDNQTFKHCIEEVSSIKKIYNYYGMVEQTGSIFMECEEGYLHSSIFSDIEIVNNDFSSCEMNEPGIVKISSVLPFSYPGHVLLSEDTGTIIGEDDCRCDRLGKYFQIHGRISNAEIRGCSDTHEQG